MKCRLYLNSTMPTMAIARPGGTTLAQYESKHFLFVKEATEDFSSTQVRRAMLEGSSIKKYVHPKVAEYIKEKKISIRP